jgi:hypothetical protein
MHTLHRPLLPCMLYYALYTLCELYSHAIYNLCALDTAPIFRALCTQRTLRVFPVHPVYHLRSKYYGYSTPISVRCSFSPRWTLGRLRLCPDTLSYDAVHIFWSSLYVLSTCTFCTLYAYLLSTLYSEYSLWLHSVVDLVYVLSLSTLSTITLRHPSCNLYDLFVSTLHHHWVHCRYYFHYCTTVHLLSLRTLSGCLYTP